MAEQVLRVVERDLEAARLLLSIDGDLDLRSESAFDEHVAPLVAGQGVQVEVDCRGCTFADVRGAGLLARLTEAGAAVVLVEPPRQLEWVLLQTETWARFRIEGSHFPELSAS